MDRRFALFAVLVALIFVVNQIVFSILYPPPEKKPADKKVAQAEAEPKPAPPAEVRAADDEPPPEDVPEVEPATREAEPERPAAELQEQPEAAPLRGTLGSGDPDSPSRMLVTWNNRGAAIERIELNSPRYRSLEKRSGYLGYLAPGDAPKRSGALLRVVGDGTPAADAGLKPDDVVTKIDDQEIRRATDLLAALSETRPGQTIAIAARRGDRVEQFTARLGHHPLELIRPERDTREVEIVEPGNHDPLSFLMTIQQFDDRTVADDNKELGGVHLRTAPWEVVHASQETVQFRQVLPALGLEIKKTYRLASVPEDQHADATYPAYNLTLDVSIANIGEQDHKVAYRLDGPNGLPIEGEWYASKVSHTWGGAGLRDVIVQFEGGGLDQVSPALLADEDFKKDWGATRSLDFSAVDAQYFSVTLIPHKRAADEILFQSVRPTRAGEIPQDSAYIRLMNVSFRLESLLADLAPGGAALEHQYVIFAGPKRPELLAHYGPPEASLKSLVYYGWFGPIARVLGDVLHYFYTIVGNYGLAIIMLTVLVRGCMFPLSRKQVLGAQKMQELQPEMKRIAEKYKNEPEKRTRATQELFRSHNYNPVGGCLLAFAQLPIFVGLYRALMVDVELRQAPLFTESIRWASNLAAPDMLWNWTGIMPDFITRGTGILGLGPYLNILPLLTITLFIWQQKMFMPPPADEQAKMQQKMMQYMMIFMGILFFKVASGLCVYFIASSLWGLTERKLMPKPKPKADTGGSTGTPVAAGPPTPTGNGAPAGKKKRRQRGRK